MIYRNKRKFTKSERFNRTNYTPSAMRGSFLHIMQNNVDDVDSFRGSTEYDISSVRHHDEFLDIK